jgi:hypothetical protein
LYTKMLAHDIEVSLSHKNVAIILLIPHSRVSAPSVIKKFVHLMSGGIFFCLPLCVVI